MQLDFGINAGFVEELYAQYLENPEAVEPGWRAFFAGKNGVIAHGLAPGPVTSPSPSLPRSPEAASRAPESVVRPRNGEPARITDAQGPSSKGPISEMPHSAPLSAHEREVLLQAARQARVYQLVNAYRVRGHLSAHLDPLGPPPPALPELDIRAFDLKLDDLDKPFPTVGVAGMAPVATLREIIQHLEETYC